MELESVKVWLNDVASSCARSSRNRTRTARSTRCTRSSARSHGRHIIEPNFETVIWNTALTAGEYAIACDSRLRVNTVYREFEMTVAQIVEEFVYDETRADLRLVARLARGKEPLGHGQGLRSVAPGAARDRAAPRCPSAALTATSASWRRTCRGARCTSSRAPAKDDPLRESGYQDCPFLGPRWHTRGRDIYGNGPGMEALGDIKQLQHEQLRKAQGIDYMTLPPVGCRAAMKGRELDTLPGGVSTSARAPASGRRTTSST
jgi:hypothetical protein